MSEAIKAALAANGLRAELRGRRAEILPVTARILDEVGAEALAEAAGRRVRPGDLVGFWSPDAAADAQAVGPEEGGVLEFLVQRADGSEMRVAAQDVPLACAALLRASLEGIEARLDAAEAPGRAVPQEASAAPAPGFAEGALRGVPALVECVEQGARAVLDSPAAAPPERSWALTAKYRIDMARLGDAPERQGPDGWIAPAPEFLDGDGAARAVDSVIAESEGFNEMQMLAQAPNEPLTEEVFGALTSTPPEEIPIFQLSDADHELALRRFEARKEAAWAEPARSRLAGILAERMPDYRFETRFFEHESADVMLVRDHAGAYLYAWDSATRAVDAGPQAAAAPEPQARLKVRDPDPDPDPDPDESPCPA